MNKIDIITVKHLAKLSQLHFSEAEIKLYQKELSTILEFIDQLQAIDVSNIEATEQVSQLTNVLRQDDIKPSLNINLKDCKKNHPSVIDDQFKVPKINF